MSADSNKTPLSYNSTLANRKQTHKKNFYLIALGLLSLVVILVFTLFQAGNIFRSVAQAATCTWSGANDGQFSDSANWSACPTGSGIPEAGDDIIFPDVATTYVINNDINVTFNSITIESLNTASYELSGNTVSVSGPIDTLSGTYSFVFSTNTTSYGLTGSGGVEILGGYTLYVGGASGNYTFSGSIGGSGTFEKVDVGIQILENSTITSSVTTNVTGYFLNLQGNTTIEGQFYSTNGGVLFNGTTNITNYNFQQSGGGINLGPSSTTNFNGYTNSSGNFGVDASTGASGQAIINNGVTDLNNSTFSMRFFGTYSVGQTFTVLTTNNTGSLSGQFSNFNSGQIIAEGWDPSTSVIANDVYISAQYSSSEVIITIDAIVPKSCVGHQTFTNSTGNFTTGTINYFSNSNCSWNIAPANADSVTLDFSSFSTEDVNDVVRVYDGLTTNSTLLGEFSGNSIPSSVTANSGLMLITFTSNANTEFSGFSANWSSTALPSPTITNISPANGPVAGGTTVTVDGTNFVSGQYQNIQSIGNSSYDGARGMVVDSSGQYITGEFTGSITLGGTTLNSAGSQDIYIAKIDSSGNYVWAVSAGGAGTDGYSRKQSMYLNEFDNTLMITGFYQASANFGSTNLTGGSGANVFIAKIDKTDGSTIWAKSAGGDTSGTVYIGNSFPAQYGTSVDVDSSGNIYFTGRIDGSSPSFDAINISLINGDSDIFVAKMDTNGNFIWAQNYGSTQNPQNQLAHGLVVDSSSNVYVASGFAGSITVGATTLNSYGASDVSNVVVFKLDSSGSDIWAVSGGTNGLLVGANDLPYDLALDSSQNLYMTGYHGGATATFGSFTLNGSPNSSTIYTTQINPSNGNFVWISQLHQTGGNGSFGTSRDMYIDSNDKIWIGGTFTNAISDGNLTATGSGANAFFAQYNTSGNLTQLESIGGTGGQLLIGGVGGNQVRAIYEYNGKIYIAGEYFDTIGIGGQTITSVGDQDGFYTTWVSDKTSIKVDGVEVQATFINSTQLSFDTPPGSSGFKDVIVTNSNGQAYTLSGGFEYQGVPAITANDITSILCSPNNGYTSANPSCTVDFAAGKSGTLTFSTSAGSCTTNAIGVTDTSASCSFTISTPSTTPYEVAVNASGGGSRSALYDIFVSPLPALTSLTPNTGPTAGGTSTIADFSKITGQDRYYGSIKDSSGNVYTVGHSFGTVDTGSGFVSGFGGEDILITKYNTSGNVVWSKVAGGAGNDRATGVTIDSSNNIYVSGYFKSAGNFGGTILNTAGHEDLFVSKLDSSGNWIWSVRGGGLGGDQAQGIDIDSSGNVYIVGHFNEVADFGATTLTSSGLTDVVIAKLDSSGNWIWANKGGGTSFEFTGGIAVNPVDNSLYISGHYNVFTNFGATNLALDMGRGGYDSFLAKADSTGNWVWAKDIGNTGVDTFAGDAAFSNKVYSDSSGNAYIMGGFYKDYIDFGSAGQITNSTPGDSAQHQTNAGAGGMAQHYIAKSDTNGDWVWATKLGDTTYYFSGALEIKNSSEGYLSTIVYTPHSFSLGGTSLTPTNTFLNAVVAKINLSNGSLSNVVQTTGTGGSELIRDITIDNSDNLVVVGNLSGTGNFGSNSYTSSGLNDAVYAKFDTTNNSFTSLQGIGGNIPFFVNLTPSANSIAFDGTNGNITAINSPIRATVTTPAHVAGFVDVTATNSLSLTSTLNNGFRYLGPAIVNSNISSMSCSPTSTAINTNVNCIITTNVDISTVSGSVNVRIGTGGTIINCPVTGSGTTLNCNNVPVGATSGTFTSQYNASGSGSTYADGNNIEVTTGSNPACGVITSTSDCAYVNLGVNGGTLTIETPPTASFGSATVSTSETTTTGDITPVVIQDLRGTYAGWTSSCTITNFAGSNTSFVIPLMNGATPKYALTPTALQVSAGGSGVLDQTLEDYTARQNISSLSATDSSGVSNSFTIASFASGGGQGVYEKTLGNELKIPAFVRNDSYSSVMTCSVS